MHDLIEKLEQAIAAQIEADRRQKAAEALALAVALSTVAPWVWPFWAPKTVGETTEGDLDDLDGADLLSWCQALHGEAQSQESQGGN